MNARRTLSRIIGFIQSFIGGVSFFLAFLLLYNVFDLQKVVSMFMLDPGLYVWIFGLFGFLSVVSGLFLLRE